MNKLMDIDILKQDWPVPDRVTFTEDREVIKYFTQGQCNALAYEIWRITGWQIALLSDGPLGDPDYIGHLFVIDDTGMAIDIRGRVPINEFRDNWLTLPYMFTFNNIAEFEHEMLLWENDIHYTSDKTARLWAYWIVDTLGS